METGGSCGKATDSWDHIGLIVHKDSKSRMVSVDLRRRLQVEKCVEKGDVWAHLSKLHTMQEDLASMGHPPMMMKCTPLS